MQLQIFAFKQPDPDFQTTYVCKDVMIGFIQCD